MEYTKQYLDQLIANKIEESPHLDYKAADSLSREEKKKREIVKDISAFANSAGGTIIYGMAENPALKHLPGKIDPIDCRDFSKEWLDQMASQIAPQIEGLRIIPVHVGPNDWSFCYIVNIPQGSTAHQATDLRYYRRRNFESTAMEDYEIRETMNRRKHPRLTAQVRLTFKNDGEHFFLVRLKNDSPVMARFYAVKVQMPYQIRSTHVVVEDATIDETDDGVCWKFDLATGLRGPLFPDDEVILRQKFKTGVRFTTPIAPSTTSIRLTIFADEMKKEEATKEVKDVYNNWG